MALDGNMLSWFVMFLAVAQHWINFLSCLALERYFRDSICHSLARLASFCPPLGELHPRHPLNIQPIVVMRGLNRQYGAALTNFVGSFLFLFYLVSLFSSSSVLLM